jgi:hypothetical protein
MKKLLLTIVTIVTLLAGVIGVGAQAGIQSMPGGGWWEASLVQNAGTDPAQVTFTPILGKGVTTGATAEPETVTVDPGANVNFMPGQYGNLTMSDGFKGSAVVSADQPIVAIGSVANNPIGDIGVSGGRAAAQYPGISQDSVASTLNYPVVKSDYKGKTTTFFIQTVETGTIDVVYTMNNGADTYTDQITTDEDGQMATFTPADADGMPVTCEDATCLGAATFTSEDTDLAGVYVEHNTTESPAQILLSTRGFTADDAGNTVYIPVVKSLWKGRTTGIQIQNVGNAAADITVDITKQAGSASGGSHVFESVPAGSSVTFFPGNHGMFDGPFGGGAMDEFVGSMEITSAQTVVAICNENDFAAASETKQTVFAGFAAGSDSILFPLVKEFYNGNTTGVQVMNVGENDVTIEAEYVFQNNSFTVDTDANGNAITLAAGESFTFWGVTEYWTGDFDAYTNDYGAVTVNATGTDAAVVGIAQEAENPVGGLGYLDTKNYEGFNQ